MAKFFIAPFLFLVVYSLGAPDARACDCFGRPQGVKGVRTCDYYWSRKAVFIGVAEKITIENREMKVVFKIERPLRGVTGETVEVFTSPSQGGCGYPFKEGERYFVYAYENEGKLRESLCGATVLLKDAEDDLAYLRELETIKPDSRVFGTVFENTQKSPDDERILEKLAGIEITITGRKGKKTYKTKTDEKGFYAFEEVPPDSYDVTAKLPPGLREIIAENASLDHLVTVQKDFRRCTGENFILTRQSPKSSIENRQEKFSGDLIIRNAARLLIDD